MAKFQNIRIPRGATVIILAQEAEPEVQTVTPVTPEPPKQPAPKVPETKEESRRVTDEEFVKTWNESNTRQEVAQKLGMKYGTVVVRALNLKGKASLKSMPRSNQRKETQTVSG